MSSPDWMLTEIDQSRRCCGPQGHGYSYKYYPVIPLALAVNKCDISRRWEARVQCVHTRTAGDKVLCFHRASGPQVTPDIYLLEQHKGPQDTLNLSLFIQQ